MAQTAAAAAPSPDAEDPFLWLEDVEASAP
jgi:hypothetical protein